MDTTFYEDSSGGNSARPTTTMLQAAQQQQQQQQQQLSTRGELSSRKRSMTLDLNSAGRPERSNKQARCSSLLTSPDLHMLQLASPELERLIIAHNGLVTTPTPTPTTLFSRTATEEQEQYARGFVDALAQLHQQQQQQQTQQPQQQQQQQPAPLQQQHATSGPDMSDSGASTSNDSFILPSSSEHSATGGDVKDEPQTVPRLGATPPLSPIDMRDQERIKLERKRLRNRIAASKCRKRKLERISRLEEKVHALKTENNELGSMVSLLRDQVCRLKQEVMTHVKQGCQIMMSSYAP